MKYIILLALPLMLAACTASHEPRQRYTWEKELAASPALMSMITEPAGLGDDDNASSRPYYLDYNEMFPPKDGGPVFPWD